MPTVLDRLLDDSYSPVVRRDVTSLTVARFTTNAVYRFAPPFIGVIARGLDVELSELGVALAITELCGLSSPILGSRRRSPVSPQLDGARPRRDQHRRRGGGSEPRHRDVRRRALRRGAVEDRVRREPRHVDRRSRAVRAAGSRRRPDRDVVGARPAPRRERARTRHRRVVLAMGLRRRSCRGGRHGGRHRSAPSGRPSRQRCHPTRRTPPIVAPASRSAACRPKDGSSWPACSA